MVPTLSNANGRENSAEKSDPLVLGPAGGVSPALDAAVADRLDAGVDRLVPATSVFGVDDDVGILGRRNAYSGAAPRARWRSFPPECRSGLAVRR